MPTNSLNEDIYPLVDFHPTAYNYSNCFLLVAVRTSGFFLPIAGSAWRVLTSFRWGPACDQQEPDCIVSRTL